MAFFRIRLVVPDLIQDHSISRWLLKFEMADDGQGDTREIERLLDFLYI